MSKGNTSLALFLVAGCLVGNFTTPCAQDLAHVPVTFTANAGQWDSRVGFQAKAGAAVAWFTTEGIDYQFYRDQSAKKSNRVEGKAVREQKKIETMLIGAKFVNANPAPEISGEGLTEYRCNYFLGNDATKWRTDVPNYESIVYRSLYSDIDLKVQSASGKLECDFIVQPGGDLAQVEVEYKGIRGLAIDSAGCLQVKTRWGTVTEHAPVVYQEVMGERQLLRASYEIRGKNRYGFKLHDDYDRAIALVVDPVVSFSTYLGGSGIDYHNDMSVNGAGEVIVCGETVSTDYPFVSGYDNVKAGSTDAYVTKFNSSGTGLVYSTYVGGGGNDQFAAVTAAEEAGFGLVLTGWTTSADFPTAVPFDASLGGTQDVIVVRMGSAGNSLLMSTFLGGSGTENGTDVIARCTSLGCSSFSYGVYVTGYTSSTDFPTVNASQTTRNGSQDAFVSLYSFSLVSSTFSYSTYYGGSSFDVGTSIAISGNIPITITIAGTTASSNLPGVDGYDNTVSGIDFFVASLAVQSGLLGPTHATYFGGAGEEGNPCIYVPSTGTVILTGWTKSSGLGTAGAFDQTYNGVCDAIYAKFTTNISVLDFATYLGGNDETFVYPHPSVLARDVQGNFYIAGGTRATNFPLVNPSDSTLGGTADGFVAKFNSTGSALSFSTLIGGSGFDASYAVAVNSAGCVFISGNTESTDFPLVSPYDNTRSSTDIFAAKICNLSCCAGLSGNVDCDGADVTDIADLSALIDNLYISFSPLCCKAEANCDGSLDGAVDIADLSALIDYLYVSFTPTAVCQ